MTDPERKLIRSLRRSWQVMGISFVCAFLAAAASMAYANRVAHESERKWCGLVTTLDDTYRETPPGTEVGKRVAEDIARLRGEFDCPPRR